ncbi:site-specific DNA recombinase [Pseudarthrobacter siccitolerans]|uniref:Site-specific DNA recombinase n=1 Tax=Pseudarthrobacter siccitolerans TaxID=861266 RepID=A0ABU0PH75_9MICC|nr:recombinase family protein [Pseudarthrobacter siccitolerans]MDQ0672917.1 site-specific DNA recombinase [Pseudarthrobacter siccitolerans]
MKVGVYLRISLDDERTGLGMERQRHDSEKLCSRLGWEVAKVYADENLSAYKRSVDRPAWEELLADLEAGAIQGVACYDVDRIARQPRQLERLIDLYESKRRLVFATVAGEIDLSTADGRFLARLLVNVANKSSADTARRVARAQLQRAQQGKVAGGGHRPYGYERDNVTVVPAEAAVIQEAAERILAGDTLISVCKSFDGQYPTPGKSVRWNRTVLRSILLNPRIAGLRSYKGSVLLAEDGSPVKAIWEPIVTVETWEQLTSLLTHKSRQANGGRVDRKYLLSGFLRCTCNAKMTGAFAKGAAEYRCPNDRGCGRTRRKAEALDAHIEETVLRRLERVELEPVGNVSSESVLDREIIEAEQSLSALIDEWTGGRISDAVFFTAQSRKEAVVNNLRSQRATEKRRRTMQAPVGAGVRDEWKTMNLSRRRAVLQEVLWQIDVLPKPVTAPKRFEGKYYEIQWRTD